MQQECGVTPEEWRVVAILSDHAQMNISDLAPLVMQPEAALRETAGWMADKGTLTFVNDDMVALSATGTLLASQLLNIAKVHEANVLSALPEDQVNLLKESLRTILTQG